MHRVVVDVKDKQLIWFGHVCSVRTKITEQRQQKVLGDEEVRRCGSTEMNGDWVSEDVERYKAI